MFREVMRNVCGQELGYEVVGEADTAADAVRLLEIHRPDVVLLDLSLRDGDAFPVIHAGGGTRFLVLSSHCDLYTVHRCERAGVDGFIDKGSNSIDSLRQAMTAISRGQRFFCATYQQIRAQLQTDPLSFHKILSDSEQTILSLIGHGCDDLEIAHWLRISPNTAKTHRSNLLKKLGVQSTPKLMAFAYAHGFARSPTLQHLNLSPLQSESN